MSITLQICVDYCQQPEALPSWRYAAGFCATVAWIGIGFWLDRKCTEYKNSNKEIWHINSLNPGYTRKDEEYNGGMKYFYMVKYLSYYSFFVLIMSALEYIVEGGVGTLARLEMWGIVSVSFGLIISLFIRMLITIFDAIKKERGSFSDVFLKDGESRASMMASKTLRGLPFRAFVYTYRLIPLSPMIVTYFILEYYFIGLDIRSAIIATTIPVLIVCCNWVALFRREDEIEYFEEHLKRNTKIDPEHKKK